MNIIAPIPALQKRIKELEEEVLRLRQQRDAANAQLDWLLEQPEVDKRGALNEILNGCKMFLIGYGLTAVALLITAVVLLS